MGAADERLRDLLVSARRSGDRGLRPLPEAARPRLLSEERSRWSRSWRRFCDGIDMRETIRNWHQRKIYVREADQFAAKLERWWSFSMKTATIGTSI